jgi:hypothetical protein
LFICFWVFLNKMNANLLIDKLKIKVKETSEIAQGTTNEQNNLLNSIKELNFKLSNYIEADIAQKRLFTESNEKFNSLKLRIDNCKDSMKNIKEKIQYLQKLVKDKNNI